MTELFSKADIDFKPLSEYASWFLDKESPNYNIIQLPPIQRNAVWNVQQVERLWDSILRGFPIGSFLLSPRKVGNKTRSIYSNEQNESEKDGYFLLDGQQRTRAILMGFKPNSNSRLWIDLDPQLAFGNSEFNDRQFLFRLITTYQPWGMNDKNPNDKLKESEKYAARKKLYGDSVRYDYEVKINALEENEDNQTKYSWPVKAKLPIPFDCLVDLCGGFRGTFIQPEWNKVIEFVPDKFKGELNLEPTKHFFLIIEALRSLLEVSNSNNKIRAVAFLKQNDLSDFLNDANDIQDPIEVLFRRINSGGTVLAGEEMAYSLLKSSWDEAYDLVSKIVNDDSIGYLFSSTGVVMAATRIVRFNLNKNDDANPSVANFRKWIGEKEDDDSFLAAIKGLLGIDNDKSKFHTVLERFCNLVLYKGNEDIGLPRKLLLSMKPTMFHPILIWLHNTDSNNDERNREAILRYLIHSFIGVADHNRASKKAVEVLKTHNDEFPDIEIYKQWRDAKIAIQIPNIDDFNTHLRFNANGSLRYLHELIGNENDIFRDFRNAFWHKKELLLWFQREYHSKWFAGYNPMSDDAYDTPYDYDHIVPYSHVITSGGSANTYSEDAELNKKFFDCRYLYINSIGNYRIWPSWANRSDNNICHTKKMRMNTGELEIDMVAKELLFESNKDFMKASFINIDQFDLWEKAGGKPREWNEDRRIAWQQAVENRVLFLFQNFYDTFGFSNWVINK